MEELLCKLSLQKNIYSKTKTYMKFIIGLSISMFLITFFDTLWTLVLYSGGVMCLFCIHNWLAITSKRRKWRDVWELLLSGVIATLSVLIFTKSYGTTTVPSYYFHGTGEVLSHTSQGRYTIRDTQWNTYMYYSKELYRPADILYITATFQQGTGINLLKSTPYWHVLYEKTERFVAEERWFDQWKWLLMNDFSWILYERRAHIVWHSHQSWTDTLHAHIHDNLYSVYTSRSAALTLGMLIGDRSWLSKEEYEWFIRSWLVHLIAVSGGNIVLIVSFVSVLLRFVPYYLRLVILIGVVISYVLLCWFDSSIVRAAAMALITLWALFFWRKVSVWRALGYVYVGMLIWNPYLLVYDIGFIFSFTATASLIYFSKVASFYTSKKTTYRSLLWRWRNTLFMPSIASCVGIAVPLLCLTGSVNLLSILSNIVIVPLVPFIMIYGFFSPLLYSVVSYDRILIPQERAIDRIYGVSNRTNEYAVTITLTWWYARVVRILLFIIVVCLIIQRRQYSDIASNNTNEEDNSTSFYKRMV